MKILGKMFRGAVLGVTDGEFSFLLFLPSTMHKQHKELNFLLKDELQVGRSVSFHAEGQYATRGSRWKAKYAEQWDSFARILCAQYRDNTFTVANVSDGVIQNKPVKW